MGSILAILANGFMVLAYFFNPSLRVKKDREKQWAIFKDLEDRLAKALADKDMPLVDTLRHWMAEMRDKYTYLKDGE